jgi:hypothetical protein
MGKKSRIKREREKLDREAAQRLERRVSQDLGPADLTVVGPVGERMSDVLIDFVGHEVSELHFPEDEAQLRSIFNFAVIAWNAAMMPPEMRESTVRDFGEVFANATPTEDRAAAQADGESMMRFMIARKQALFRVSGAPSWDTSCRRASKATPST